MQDQTDREFKEYTLSLDKAKKLLSGVLFTEMEDGSWCWHRPEDVQSGQYVALSEGDWVELNLAERGGDLVLAGHHDATGSAAFEGADAKAIRLDASRQKRAIR